MQKEAKLRLASLAILLLTSLAACSEPTSDPAATDNPAAESATAPSVADDAIGGVVTSATGVEAGVWVIAETGDFETFFARIVVTDEQGRFLIPELPAADYQVWTRGYGLADSPKLAARGGSNLDLSASIAETDAIAAEIYPAAYWYAMMRLPEETELTEVEGGLNAYLTFMKNMGCVGCHQLGNLATRTLPEAFAGFE